MINTIGKQNELTTLTTTRASAKPGQVAIERWTEEEDINLSIAFQKHGFQWTLIAKDPGMGFTNRTANQIRDRFRHKFPAHYQSSVPIPIHEPIKRLNGWARAKKKTQKKKTANTDQEDRDFSNALIRNDVGEQRSRAPAPKTKHLTITDLVLPTQSSPNLHTKRVPVLPLPDSDSEADSEFSSSSETQSSPISGLHPCHGKNTYRGAVDAVGTEEVRHLSVMGLLNSEDGRMGRLPSLRNAEDGSYGESMTLPPLLWEDMAAKPLFEFG